MASTAHVAKLLRAPVVLVVDASSQSRSVAALVHGFVSWDPEVRVGGVILNKVASDRHEELLREALESAGVPVLGVLRRVAQVDTPSRHLGLVPVAERRGAAVEAVAAMAAQVAAGCDLEGLMEVARGAGELGSAAWDAGAALRFSPPPPLPSPTLNFVRAGGPPSDPGGCRPQTPASALDGPRPQTPDGLKGKRRSEVGEASLVAGTSAQPDTASTSTRPVVAVAGGAAFTFSYAEHAELLTAAGADVVTFDPLRDEALPDGTAGLVIGGGFPEVYGAELAANAPLLKAVTSLVEAGAPVAAECAGLLYLCRELDGRPMCGVIDASARMSERLTLGYRDAVAVSDSVLASAGTRMRGHEFHRTVVEPGAGSAPAWGFRGARSRVEGFVARNVHASYLHTHWAGEPGVARRFVERCRTS